VRVPTDGQTHTHTDRQTQTDFIICPMLYAIAMGQIIISRQMLQNNHFLILFSDHFMLFFSFVVTFSSICYSGHCMKHGLD